MMKALGMALLTMGIVCTGCGTDDATPSGTHCAANATCPAGKEGDGCMYIADSCHGEGGWEYSCTAGEWTPVEYTGCPVFGDDGGGDDGGID